MLREAQATEHRFVLLDQVIEANLDMLFTGMEIFEHHLFRVTRNADLALEEDEADDLLVAIEEELRRRRFGEAVRLEVERSMPEATRELLLRGLGLTEDETYEVRGMLDLTGLWQLADLDRPDLKSAAVDAGHPAAAPAARRGRAGRRLRRDPGGRPARPPPVRELRGERRAARRAGGRRPGRPDDQADAVPDVARLADRRHLIRAAERGKQVVVLVEIKARFDEQANIDWARKLERAGAHVVYGLVGLKTHCKTLLVVRREGSALRRYVHIGTGNYNTRTARTYVDLGLLTCRPDIGADVSDLFNILTGLSRQRTFRRLLVAPTGLRTRFLELVDREIEHAQAGRPARIVLKMNALVDRACVEALYRASPAGVDIDADHPRRVHAVPGVHGMSDAIRVRSIIGEFLEHSRIWRFENGGSAEWYIGSADLMDRNLDRRIEAFVPIDDPEARAGLDEILEIMLADDRRAWQLGSDGGWQRTDAVRGVPGTLDTHRILRERTLERVAAASPRRPHAVAGSLEPWA